MINTNITIKDLKDHIIPISRFNRGEAGKVFDEIKRTGVKVVMKNNMPIAVLIDPDQYREIVEMMEDFALFLEADNRMKQVDQSEILSESQLMKDLGIEESDLDEINVEIEA